MIFSDVVLENKGDAPRRIRPKAHLEKNTPPLAAQPHSRPTAQHSTAHPGAVPDRPTPKAAKGPLPYAPQAYSSLVATRASSY